MDSWSIRLHPYYTGTCINFFYQYFLHKIIEVVQ